LAIARAECGLSDLKAAATKQITRHNVAAETAKNPEFQIAPCPAANAPNNSVQVRLTETSCTSGSATDTPIKPTVLNPENHSQAFPSCRRKTLAPTAPSTRGQAMPLRPSQIKRTNGIRIRGQLIRRAAIESKLVLNRTQVSAGKTFTCKIAGTAKLLRARTNVITPACKSAGRAIGSSR